MATTTAHKKKWRTARCCVLRARSRCLGLLLGTARRFSPHAATPCAGFVWTRFPWPAPCVQCVPPQSRPQRPMQSQDCVVCSPAAQTAPRRVLHQWGNGRFVALAGMRLRCVMVSRRARNLPSPTTCIAIVTQATPRCDSVNKTAWCCAKIAPLLMVATSRGRSHRVPSHCFERHLTLRCSRYATKGLGLGFWRRLQWL